MVNNWFTSFIAFIISIPARLKGMKFGKNSYIGFGYDFLFGRLKGVIIGDNVIIGRNSWIQTLIDYGGNPEVIIGDGTSIARNVTISAMKSVRIGNNCLISYNVSIIDCEHKLMDINISPSKSGITEGKNIIIEDDCFIGSHAFITKGVHLGKHTIVGANSVVTRSFPAYSVIAGNPAQLIKKLT